MSNISLAELLITDGTDVVDLLHHFRLLSWQPVETPMKNGGVWQTTPVGDGRRMVAKYYDNTNEQMALAVKAGHQDAAIKDLNRMRNILERASDYWINNVNNVPVWIEARSGQESNRRYAILMSGSVPADPPPYSEPFAGRLQAIGVIQITIERDHWKDNLPGIGTDVLVDSVYEYDGTEYGTTDAASLGLEATSRCFVANCRGHSNITHIFRADGTGANMAEEALPWDLFSASDEWTYFGIEASIGVNVNNSHIPINIVFNLNMGDLQTQYRTFTWEFFDPFPAPGAWKDLSTIDDNFKFIGITQDGYLDLMEPLQIDGHVGTAILEFFVSQYRVPFFGSFVTGALITFNGYSVPSTVINGERGCYLRCKCVLAAVPSAGGVDELPVIPEQTDIKVYTANWPYIDIDASGVTGNIPALMETKIRSAITQTFVESACYYPDRLESNFIMGYRDLARGENFTAYILLGESDSSAAFNPTGILLEYPYITFRDDLQAAITDTSGGVSSYNTGISDVLQNITTPFGFATYCEFHQADSYLGVTYTDMSDTEFDFAKVKFDASIADEYKGRFRVYLRFVRDSQYQYPGADEIYLRLKIETNEGVYYTEYKNTLNRELLDFGLISLYDNKLIAKIRANGILPALDSAIEITVQVRTGTITATPSADPCYVFLCDLVLIPVDEWFCSLYPYATPMTNVGSISEPKEVITAQTYEDPTDPNTIYHYSEIQSDGEMILPYSSTKKRLWIIKTWYDSANGVWASNPYELSLISAQITNRYKSMRGED